MGHAGHGGFLELMLGGQVIYRVYWPRVSNKNTRQQRGLHEFEQGAVDKKVITIVKSEAGKFNLIFSSMAVTNTISLEHG